MLILTKPRFFRLKCNLNFFHSSSPVLLLLKSLLASKQRYHSVHFEMYKTISLQFRCTGVGHKYLRPANYGTVLLKYASSANVFKFEEKKIIKGNARKLKETSCKVFRRLFRILLPLVFDAHVERGRSIGRYHQ